MQLPPSPTQLAAQLVTAKLQPGDIALDATAGNGHDSLRLAQHIGEHGHLHSFDIQAAAIQATREKLQNHQLSKRASLHQHCHSQLAQHLPAKHQHQLQLAIFNLGYLPGGDHQIITQSSTTLTALQAALHHLRPHGWLIITAYPGHPGGSQEAQSVQHWLSQLPRHQHLIHSIHQPNLSSSAPHTHILEKQAPKKPSKTS